MSTRVSIMMSDHIARYVESQEASQNKSRSELISDLLNEWYEAELQVRYQQYISGDLTLRGMARHLGLDYRQLYDLMEVKGLAV